MLRRWTKEDISYLVREWSNTPLPRMAKHLGRSMRATQAKAITLGLGAANRGLTTVYTIEREYGYDRERIHKAMEHLGMKRAPGMSRSTASRKGGVRTYIKDKDLGALLSFLAAYPDGERLYSPTARKTGALMWGTGGKPPQCLGCGRTDRKHAYKGKCAPCHQRAYRQAKLAREKAMPTHSPI